jgi:DNA-binding MarR family transcriptional regulator
MPGGSNTAAETTAAVDILDITPRLNRWAESRVTQAASDVKLSLRQLSALSMIEDENTTLGDVARKLMVTPAVVTGLIDRLERRGYVRRINSTGDRRRVLLSLTDEGRAAAESAQQFLISELEVALGKLSADDLKALDRALQLLKPVARELESGSPSAPNTRP